MIMDAPSRHKAHSVFAGYATFEASKLEAKFGRGVFNIINKKMRVFDVVEDELGRDAYSYEKDYTKGYKLNESVLDILDNFLKGSKYRRHILENLDGELATIPPNALASRRKPPIGLDGKVKTAQPKVGFKVKVLAAVPVNKVMLLKLINELEKIIFSIERGFYQESIFNPEPDIRRLKTLWRSANQILGLSNSTNPGMSGSLVHRYEQSNSGRFYAQDTNFQNTHSLIRKAALHGFYDYDIENCHYSILEQMASPYFKCKAIRHYLNRKTGIRQGLMTRLKITKNQAKKCLIALVYGARFSLREDDDEQPLDAIAKTLGSIEKADALFNSRLFKALRDDISASRRVIIANCEVSRKGQIHNALGLPMPANAAPEKMLAHLLQGVEAMALDAMHSLYPDKIVLLQHDGFTSTSELDTGRMVAAIKEKTGYLLNVSTDGAITIPHDALSHEPVKVNKTTENSLKPFTHAGFP